MFFSDVKQMERLPGQNLIIKLFVDGIVRTCFINIILQTFLEEGDSSLNINSFAIDRDQFSLPNQSRKAVFRIRVRSDPYHLVGSGSGSVSGSIDMDPGSAKN